MGTYRDAVNLASDMDTFDAVTAGLGLNPIAAGNFVGDLLGLGNSKQVDAALASYDALMGEAQNVYGQNMGDLGKYGNLLQSTYGEGAGKYNDALNQYLNSDVFQGKEFNYGGSINDFYDKFANQRAQQAMDALRGSYGDMMSSEYANAMAAKQQALSSEEWEKAYNKLIQDRQQAMAEWQANQDTGWKNWNAMQDRYKTAVDAYGRDRDALLSGQGDVLSNTISARNANLSTLSDLTQAKANAELQRQSGNAALLGFAGDIIGAIL